MLRKTFALLVLSTLGLLPAGRVLCQISCAGESTPGQAAHAHHCQSSSPAAATLEAADSCGNHTFGEQAPALLTTKIDSGVAPETSSIVEAPALVSREFSRPGRRAPTLSSPPGFSILRI